MTGRHRARRLLLASALVLMASRIHAMADQRQIADGGGPWCGEVASLQPYIEAFLAGDKQALSVARDCAWLDAGTVIDVLEETEVVEGAPHLLKIRLVDRGDVVGYTPGNVVDRFHRRDPFLGGRR